ncbi:putative DD41D transposase [Trichonephila clavipes]|nr:putative DD41D transposase [Trichonephila clavipes]
MPSLSFQLSANKPIRRNVVNILFRDGVHPTEKKNGEHPLNDEAHFWLNGYVNKQNCRIWNEANPQVYVETPLHPEKLTVWCALWAGGIIGPFFFKNYEGHNVTVNGDRYRAMITNVFIPELNNHDVQELWFQQDGATCHTARATIDLLKDSFVDRLISRFGPVNRPPRSCELTPFLFSVGLCKVIGLCGEWCKRKLAFPPFLQSPVLVPKPNLTKGTYSASIRLSPPGSSERPRGKFESCVILD